MDVTVPAVVVLCGILVCLLNQTYAQDIAWAGIVISVVTIDIFDKGGAYIYVLFAKLVSGMMHTRMVPDFVVYPLDVIYMFAGTGIMDRKNNTKSRQIALMCTATSCIVMARHSNVILQPIHMVACRLVLYVGCVVYSTVDKWTAVSRSIWVLHVHYFILPAAAVQLYMYMIRRPRTRLVTPVVPAKKNSVVWTAQGPMAV